MQEDQIEDVQGTDRTNAFDEGRLAVSVERLQREAACVDLASLGHELHHLAVHGQVSWKRFVPEFGKAALKAQRDAGTVKQHGRFEALTLQASGLQKVHEADRAF